MTTPESSQPVTTAKEELIAAGIMDAYRSDNRPWVLGFSGGKDSTAMVQMVYRAMVALPDAERHKHIYVLASDTRVETPQISLEPRSVGRRPELSLASRRGSGQGPGPRARRSGAGSRRRAPRPLPARETGWLRRCLPLANRKLRRPTPRPPQGIVAGST